jgi:hypothetical protein
MKTFAKFNKFLGNFTLIKKDGLVYVVPASAPNIIQSWLQQRISK